jgi:hypothetical protein
MSSIPANIAFDAARHIIAQSAINERFMTIITTRCFVQCNDSASLVTDPEESSRNNLPILRRNVVRIQGTARGA